MSKRRSRKRQYGTGSVFRRLTAPFWTLRYRDNSGDTHTKSGFRSKDDAEEALESLLDTPTVAKNAPVLSVLVEKWLESRKLTHENWYCDTLRWENHLKPIIGNLTPHEVTPAVVKDIIDAKFAQGNLKPGTIGLIISLLSTIYSDLAYSYGSQNPVSGLSKKTKRTLKSDHDSESVPFLKTMTDVTNVINSLKAPYNVAFAIGAYAGLRTGEVLGLDWSNVDLVNRKIRVCQQVTGNKMKLYPKDGDNRITIIPDALLPILEQYRIATGGAGLLFKPMSNRGGALARGGHGARYMSPATLNEALSKALVELGLPSMTWYQSTRHTMASQWVLNGGSMEILQKLMGHSSVLVTARYAHLKIDTFSQADLSRLAA